MNTTSPLKLKRSTQKHCKKCHKTAENYDVKKCTKCKSTNWEYGNVNHEENYKKLVNVLESSGFI